MARLYGQFLPFGSDDPCVVASYSLKSANDIGSATETGTGTYDSVKGWKPDQVTDGSRLDFGSAIVPTLTDLDEGCTIQLEVETTAFFDIDSGATSNYIFVCQSTTGEKRYYIAGNSDQGNTIKPKLKTLGTGSTYTPAVVDIGGKGEFITLHYSFRRGFVDFYVDYQLIATFDNEETDTSSLFDNFKLANRSAGVTQYHGYMRNLQILNRPIFPILNYAYSRIHVIGDSLPQHGNWLGTATGGMPVLGTDNTNPGLWSEAGMTPTISRYLSRRNAVARVECYAVGSTTVVASGSDDIIDQVDGTGNGVGLVEDDALARRPQIVVIHGGTNDALQAAPDLAEDGAFHVAYQNLVDEVNTRNPGAKIFACTIPSVHNDATYDLAKYVTQVNDVNARITQVANTNPNVYLVDVFTAVGGHTGTSPYMQTDDLHYNAAGSHFVGEFIAAAILAQI